MSRNDAPLSVAVVRNGLNSDWTADKIERLTALWFEGHPVAEIARRMGISKNAVVGKVHRLNLPSRPSPIRHSDGVGKRPRPPKRAPKVTLAISAEPVAPPVVIVRRIEPCSYIVRSEGRRHVYCDAPATGSPYCPEHHRLCYLPKKTGPFAPNVRFDDLARGRLCAANSL